MNIYQLKKLSEQKITVYEGSDCVEGCYRNAVLTDENGNEDYEIVLTGSDALVLLEVGQLLLADLRCDSCYINGEWHDEYYLMSIHPLEENAKVEYVKELNTNLI